MIKPLLRALRKHKTSKLLFFLLVLIIPLNVGKHVVLRESYVSGLLVDYLIPTIYVQDIVALLLLLAAVVEAFNSKKTFFASPALAVLAVFLFAVFLSALSSVVLAVSLVAFGRLLLYAGVFVYATYNFDAAADLPVLKKLLVADILLLGLLGVAQYIKQGAVFNNYLFFGEQPYTAGTPEIYRDSLFGFTKVGSYGLFRHPNVFAAYLVLAVSFLLLFFKKTKLLLVTSFVGFAALLCTFSYIAIFTLVIGLAFSFLSTKFKVFANARLYTVLCVAVLVLPLFLPLLPVPLPIKTSVSYYRRADLALASYKIFYNYPLFGVGFGGFTKLAESYTSLGSVIRFDQPVHNLFLLIASESGVFAVLLFLAFLSVVFAQSSRGKNVAVVRIFELQFLLLAGFDHYFLSSQQLMLLFWLVAGLLCSKELDNVSYL